MSQAVYRASNAFLPIFQTLHDTTYSSGNSTADLGEVISYTLQHTSNIWISSCVQMPREYATHRESHMIRTVLGKNGTCRSYGVYDRFQSSTESQRPPNHNTRCFEKSAVCGLEIVRHRDGIFRHSEGPYRAYHQLSLQYNLGMSTVAVEVTPQ